jgi:hypothetical protein
MGRSVGQGQDHGEEGEGGLGLGPGGEGAEEGAVEARIGNAVLAEEEVVTDVQAGVTVSVQLADGTSDMAEAESAVTVAEAGAGAAGGAAADVESQVMRALIRDTARLGQLGFGRSGLRACVRLCTAG